MKLASELQRSLLELATRNRKVKILQRGVPFVILVVGVNGSGKTTTIAKLARYFLEQDYGVLLAAGDSRFQSQRSRRCQKLARAGSSRTSTY